MVLRIACSILDFATRSVAHLLVKARNHGPSSAEAAPHASYSDVFFLEVSSCCPQRFLSIKRQRFLKGCAKAFQQLLTRCFLTIHARNLFNPTNPPCSIILNNCCVFLIHRYPYLPWHFLNFFPLPQGHASLRPTLSCSRWTVLAAIGSSPRLRVSLGGAMTGGGGGGGASPRTA